PIVQIGHHEIAERCPQKNHHVQWHLTVPPTTQNPYDRPGEKTKHYDKPADTIAHGCLQITVVHLAEHASIALPEFRGIENDFTGPVAPASQWPLTDSIKSL